jgi:MFS family permease
MSIGSFLGYHRNVAVLAASLFGMALGEELWQSYVPLYLQALGAGGVAIGLFGSFKDLLDGLYQYPGGWLADRLGRRRSLLVFTSLAIVGYATYALARSWGVVFVGLLGVMAWKAGAFPTTFAVIGDSLPPERRAVAFGVQSALVRVPRIIGAPVGGMLIAAGGVVGGVRLALSITIALALFVALVQYLGYDRQPPPPAPPEPHQSVRSIVSGMPAALTRLLAADCLVRIGEGIAASFIVLYVTGTQQLSAAQFGTLYAIQQAVAIAFYVPGGKVADWVGRTPLVALTFVFFAAFPLAVGLAGSYAALVGAFVIGGLKELGEPARKSLIVDLAPDDRRARTVGVYYGIRNLLVVPAGLLGGLLWQVSPTLPLYTAFIVGMIGVVVFLRSARHE